MNKKYYETNCRAVYFPQTLAISSQRHARLVIPDDEKVTLRLSSFRPAETRLTNTDSDAPVSEINLNSLRAADQLLIETAHSVYSFTITDPTVPSGRLIGGVLGNRAVNASLMICGGLRFGHKNLRAGSELTFLIERGNSLRRLTTSAVTRLLRRNEARSGGFPAITRRVSMEHLSSDKSDS